MDFKTLFLSVVVLTFTCTATAEDTPCPIYPRCSRFPVSDEPCSGSDEANPCPGGKAACYTNPETSQIVSCCCIKYDPIYKHLISGSTKPAFTPGKLRVYYMRFCPYSHRIMMTSVAKNVSTDVVFVNLKNKPEWFAVGLGGKVPIIETEEDGSINESLIEADYLDEAYTRRRRGINSLYPANLFKKAKDRQLVENYNKFIPGALFDILYVTGYTNSSAVPTLMKNFENYITQLGHELTLRGTKYFGGDCAPGMVDYMIWPWIERRQIFPMFYPSSYDYSSNSARIAEWADLMKQDNAVSTFGLSPEVHYQYALSQRAGNPDYDMLAGI